MNIYRIMEILVDHIKKDYSKDISVFKVFDRQDSGCISFGVATEQVISLLNTPIKCHH